MTVAAAVHPKRRTPEQWAAIRIAWEMRDEDGASIASIARAFEVPHVELLRRARREGWAHPAPKQRYEPGHGVVAATQVRARCFVCGAVYDATLSLDGASPHCAEVLSA